MTLTDQQSQRIAGRAILLIHPTMMDGRWSQRRGGAGHGAVLPSAPAAEPRTSPLTVRIDLGNRSSAQRWAGAHSHGGGHLGRVTANCPKLHVSATVLPPRQQPPSRHPEPVSRHQRRITSPVPGFCDGSPMTASGAHTDRRGRPRAGRPRRQARRLLGLAGRHPPGHHLGRGPWRRRRTGCCGGQATGATWPPSSPGRASSPAAATPPTATTPCCAPSRRSCPCRSWATPATRPPRPSPP